MAAQTVQKAFSEFEKNTVRLPKKQTDRAKAVHPKIRAAVRANLDGLLICDFLAGSFARHVQTAPTLKDIDVILVLSDPDGTLRASASAALDRIALAAAGCELVVGTPEKCVRAVKVSIDGEEFTVDLVAALEDPDGELLLARYKPQDGHDDWTPARPRAQTDVHWDKDAETGNVFIPSVRIVKFWNQRDINKMGEKNAMPSYLAESILFHEVTEECDYADSVIAFFRAAHRHLSDPAPTVRCPGDPDNFVDEMLEDDRRRHALTRVESALAHAEAAIDEPDPGVAMDHWAEVFGPSFPAPTGDTSNLADALRTGAVVASGTGISAKPNGGRQVIPSRPWRTA